MSVLQPPADPPAQRLPNPPQSRDRVAAAFEKLASSASELNTVSDELAKPIHSIDATLQKLNLGVSAWVEFASTLDPETDLVSVQSIGYGKVAGMWGIAIYDRCEDISHQKWRFNEAPRTYRLESLEKLPELLEKLAETANKTATDLKSKIILTKHVATTISQMASVVPARRK